MAGDLKFVAYLRTSTTDQTLGLDAQRATVSKFVEARGGKIVGCFQEQESGARADRPQLDAALAHARDRGATLLVAKLDRLSRDVEFLARLMKGAVPLAFCDLPEASELTVTMMSAIAQFERKRIRERTREALKAKKDRGYGPDNPKPGNPAGAAAFGKAAARGRSLGTAVLQGGADAFAERMRGHIERARAAGAGTLQEIAHWLNADHVEARRGGPWNAEGVRRVLKRLEPR